MNNEAYVQMHPWYKGYSGEIVEIEGKHTVTGIYDMPEDDILEITELPIGKWTRDYKNFLEDLVEKEVIEDIREYHQENRVHFVLTVPKLMDIARGVGIIKTFKLQTTLASSNQVLFNSDGSIYRFKTEEDIMKEWYALRSSLYDRRKEY
jgi:DNA topoisomerase-2